MALADTARLIASLELDPRKFTKGLSAADKALGKTEGRAFKAGQQIGTGIKNGIRIAAVGIGTLAVNVQQGLDSLIELEKQQAQTNAVLKSTGGVARVTGKDVTRLAEKYEGLNATIGDEVIRSGENMLLTFTNIRKKAFEPTLRAVLDMNTAMGKGPEGLTNTAILVGKALNDPTKGLTALRRVGVAFSASQIKRIKQLQKEGKLYEAQKLILKELNKEFGGSFLAQGNTTAGKVAKFTDAIDDLQRALAEALLPAIGEIADALTTLLNDPATKQGIRNLGKDIAKLFSGENIRAGAKIVGDVIKAIRDAAPDIKSGLSTAADVIGKVVEAFQKLPPDVQKLAVGALVANKLTGGLVTNLAGGIVGAILGQLKSAVVNVSGAVVNVNGAGGVPGGGATPVGGGGKAGTALKALGALTIIGSLVKLSADSIQGFVDKNQELKGKGLNQAEIAAIRYYSASTADQQTMVKRLGYLPKKSDYDAGVAKLDAALKPVDQSTRQAAQETQRQGERQVQSAKQIKASVDASKARQVAASLETARETRRSGVVSAAAARAAGERARGGGLAAAGAINKKDFSPHVGVTVNSNVNVSLRDLTRRLSVKQYMAIYG